ncbi:transcriptional regulator [Draconibacterium orientale]|uniref:Transcriptional regulator n=1 Tax=Draconibacterium orientale TaxID=1168034 RepID=X5DW96_9BACT|nr:Crp/Fnr family transcriptional regulator [Draconibacterium orientale]AHW59480.1 transcriptional regulator [Draconibacterium orientale]SES88575.1 transcriptional regulator [Draconibacterium orientale]
MIDYSVLVKSPLFHGIPDEECRALFSKIHYQVRKFEKDAIVVQGGEEVTNLFVVLSGSVRGEMIDYSGKTVKIEDIEAPRPLAAAFLFGKENKFPVTVTANKKAELLAIPVVEFLKLLQMNTRLLRNYLNSISTRAQFLSQKLHFLSFKTIKEKVAHFLLQQAGDLYHSFELKNTQQQLAEMFGVTRPSLARVLGDMQNEGLIKIEKKTVTLLDKEELNSLLKNG